MQYLGGKSRLAAKFAPILIDALKSGNGKFYEPFVGGFNVVPTIYEHVNKALCNDLHPGLIRMYRALKDGWEPPGMLTEEEYSRIKATPNWDDPLTAFAAFGCSFGGKEFGGYARNARDDNYSERAKNSLLKKVVGMNKVYFVHADYRWWKIGSGCTVYADPPYMATTKYKVGGGFDYVSFYSWAERLAAIGCRVFVSEFTVPKRDGWKVVWKLERKLDISSKRVVDCLVEVTA